jgi:hypothetical protein
MVISLTLDDRLNVAREVIIALQPPCLPAAVYCYASRSSRLKIPCLANGLARDQLN